MRNKSLFGFLAITPVVNIIGFLIFYFLFSKLIVGGVSDNVHIKISELPNFLSPLFGLIGFLTVINVFGLVFFIIYIANNDSNQLVTNDRMLWIILLFFIAQLGFLGYWAINYLPALQ